MYIQRTKKLLIQLTALVLFSLGATALAFDGLTVGLGLGLPSDGAVPINVRASYPVYSFEVSDTSIDLRARLDVTTASSFNAIPTFAVTAVAITNSGEAYPYLGIGGALSFLPVEPTITMFSAQFLLGLQVPIASGFSAAIEGALATNTYATNAQLTLAVEYTFGR